MKKKHVRASGLFLAEILISILFFSLVSVLCVRLFVQSHLISCDAEEMEEAGQKCASVAELMESTDSTEEFYTLLESTYGINPSQDGEFILGYDGNYVLTQTDKAEYIIVANVKQESDIAKLDMQFIRTKDDTTVYDLSASHHYPMEVTDAKD